MDYETRIQSLITEFEETMVFLCKNDALAFKERLGTARQKLTGIVVDEPESGYRIQLLLDQMQKIETQVDDLIEGME